MKSGSVVPKTKAAAANGEYKYLGYATSGMLPVPNVHVGSQSNRACRAAAETRLKRRDPTGSKLIFSHPVAQPPRAHNSM